MYDNNYYDSLPDIFLNHFNNKKLFTVNGKIGLSDSVSRLEKLNNYMNKNGYTFINTNKLINYHSEVFSFNNIFNYKSDFYNSNSFDLICQNFNDLQKKMKENNNYLNINLSDSSFFNIKNDNEDNFLFFNIDHKINLDLNENKILMCFRYNDLFEKTNKNYIYNKRNIFKMDCYYNFLKNKKICFDKYLFYISSDDFKNKELKQKYDLLNIDKFKNKINIEESLIGKNNVIDNELLNLILKNKFKYLLSGNNSSFIWFIKKYFQLGSYVFVVKNPAYLPNDINFKIKN